MEISFIIPVYNAEKTLPQCLDSILLQLPKNSYEIIIINDGSSDQSLAIAQAYAQKHPQIQVINQENTGVSQARNRGIAQAQGKWLQMVDSDDYLQPNYTQVVQQYLQRTDIDLILFNETCETIAPVQEYLNFQAIGDEIIAMFQANEMNPPWNKLFRRSIIAEYDLKFEKTLSLGEDLLFNLNYLEKTTRKIIHLNQNLYYYRSDNQHSLKSKFYANRLAVMKYLAATTQNWFVRNYQMTPKVIAFLANDKYDYLSGCYTNLFRTSHQLSQAMVAQELETIFNDEYFQKQISFVDSRYRLKNGIVYLVTKLKSKKITRILYQKILR